MRLQLQPLDRALGERAALQQLVLRLVVVHPALHQVYQLLVGQHVGGVPVDQDLRRRLVDGPSGVVVENGGREAQRQTRHHDRATLVEHREIATGVLKDRLLGHDTSPGDPPPGAR